MFKLRKADREFIEAHRGCYSPDPCWYIALVHWGREHKVLDRAGRSLAPGSIDELFLPELASASALSAGPSASRLLFGGYLFFRCRMTDEVYLTLSSDPCVFRIYGRAFRIPEPVDNEEVRLFRAMLKADPQPCFITGRHCGRIARVDSGLLAGQTGRVIEVSMRSVKLEVNYSFLDQGHAIIVSVPRQLVRLDPDQVADDRTLSTLFESKGRDR